MSRSKSPTPALGPNSSGQPLHNVMRDSDVDYIVSSAKELSVQAGGMSWKKRAFLSLEPEFAMKPLVTDERGYREIAFYENLSFSSQHKSTTHSDASKVRSHSVVEVAQKEIDLLRRFATFTPSYYGVVNPPANPPTIATGRSWLLLKDTTASFLSPSVIDLKIGTQSFEPGCGKEKQRREIEKYPPQSEFGFRITGMNVYDPDNAASDENGYRIYDKHFGRGLHTKEHLKSAFLSFFSQTNKNVSEKSSAPHPPAHLVGDRSLRPHGGVRNRIIMQFRQQLKQVARWFESNDIFLFYSSSVLFIYEGGEASKDWDDKTFNRDGAKLRLIDFAHVRRMGDGGNGIVEGDKTDTGYLAGIYKLLEITDEILSEQNDIGGLN